MNKPIRTMAILCLALFLALLVNSTYLQSSRPTSSTRATATSACGTRSSPGSAGDPRRRPLGRQSVPSRRRAQVPAPLPAAAQVRPPHRLLLLHLRRNAVEATQNDILSGSDARLFVNRVDDLFGTASPRAATSSSPSTRAQTAAYKALRPWREPRAASSRSIRRPARSWRWRPPRPTTRMCSPRTGSPQVRKPWKQLIADPNNPMLNRAIQEIYPARLDVQARHRGRRALQRQYTPRVDRARRRRTATYPRPTTSLPNDERGRPAAAAEITLTQALTISCNAAFGVARPGRSGRRAARAGGEVRLRRDAQHRHERPGQRVPDRPRRSRRRTQSAIGQYDVAATPLQMAMVAATSPTAAR